MIVLILDRCRIRASSAEAQQSILTVVGIGLHRRSTRARRQIAIRIPAVALDPVVEETIISVVTQRLSSRPIHTPRQVATSIVAVGVNLIWDVRE